MTTTFEAPGHGQWALDLSHYPGGITPISQWLLKDGMRRGLSTVFAELGLPLEGIDVAFVHDYMYTRLRPLIGADSKPRKPPPAPILKLASRVHPAFRARNKTAIATLRDRPSNAVVATWHDETRPRLLEENQQFQSFDPAAANDVELQQHISALLDHLHRTFELHFWLHGHDLGPIARYLHNAMAWGLEPVAAIELLAGASPTTALPIETLCKLREAIESAPTPVKTLDDIRALSDETCELLDGYLATRGHILATGYDLDNRTLGEMPEVIMSSIRAATPPPEHSIEDATKTLREQVDPAEREVFDERLADARRVMDMRDDNGPLTIEWPVGLLRRALLAAGDRLVERSEISRADNTFELTPDEARSLFGGTLPDRAEIDRRAELRASHDALTPPALLGPEEPEPPLDVLPPALAELTAMVQVAMEHIGIDGSRPESDLTGAGIGDATYQGIARVAMTADEAFDSLEPGDVLVVRATSPAFNAVLAIAGAVITSDGGVLSHAAVLSRELGIPAVIGASGALAIADGSLVEVNASAGVVRVLS